MNRAGRAAKSCLHQLLKTPKAASEKKARLL
jgi:hypothetical protein